MRAYQAGTDENAVNASIAIYHVRRWGESLAESIVCHADDKAEAFRLVDDVMPALTDGVRRLMGGFSADAPAEGARRAAT